MTGPENPVCPACGEAVGATSKYCMHCDADFDAPVEESEFAGGDADAGASGDRRTSDEAAADDGGDWGGADQDAIDDGGDWGDSDQAVTDHPSGWDDGGPGDEGHTQGWTEEGDDASTAAGAEATSGTTPDATSGASTAAASDHGATDDAASERGGSTGRNVLQSVARIGAVLLTVFVGLLTTVALMLLTVEVIELWLPILAVSLIGIVTGGVVIARQDTGIDALADALYVAAAVLVLLPFSFMLFLPTNDPVLDRILAGLAFSLFGSFLAVPMFVVGWWLQPDDEEIPWT